MMDFSLYSYAGGVGLRMGFGVGKMNRSEAEYETRLNLLTFSPVNGFNGSVVGG
jgi:hypothetical protein